MYLSNVALQAVCFTVQFLVGDRRSVSCLRMKTPLTFLFNILRRAKATNLNLKQIQKQSPN